MDSVYGARKQMNDGVARNRLSIPFRFFFCISNWTVKRWVCMGWMWWVNGALRARLVSNTSLLVAISNGVCVNVQLEWVRSMVGLYAWVRDSSCRWEPKTFTWSLLNNGTSVFMLWESHTSAQWPLRYYMTIAHMSNQSFGFVEILMFWRHVIAMMNMVNIWREFRNICAYDEFNTKHSTHRQRTFFAYSLLCL